MILTWPGHVGSCTKNELFHFWGLKHVKTCPTVWYLGNVVQNGAISIMQRGFISDYYKVKPIGQWGKILVMGTGFVDYLGQGTLLMSAEEGFLKVPCFAQMKIEQTLF